MSYPGEEHRRDAGDLDGYLSLYDEGIALHGYSPEPMNKDQVRGFYQGIFSAFDTPKLEFHEVLWDGDVASIRRLRGEAEEGARQEPDDEGEPETT